jgi:uncharacterized protein with LGFP repeats
MSYGSTTFADWGNDLKKYADMGGPGGKLGWTLSDPQGIAGGAASYFTGGNCGNPGPYGSNSAVYDSSSGAHEVQGCIYAFYITYGGGGPGGSLGFPTSDEYINAAGYHESTFQNGTVTWINGQAQVCLGATC